MLSFSNVKNMEVPVNCLEVWLLSRPEKKSRGLLQVISCLYCYFSIEILMEKSNYPSYNLKTQDQKNFTIFC